MRPVTASLLNALRGSHRMVARARLVTPGQTGTNPGPLAADGSPLYELPITTGDVQFDANADVRSTLGLETLWPWPPGETELMNPYGSEIFIERGVMYGDGIREWVSQGFFRIMKLDQDDAPRGPLSVSGKDRMQGIIEARTLTPIVFPDGTDAQTLFTTLINEVYPTVPITYDFVPTSVTWQGNHVLEEDRFKFLTEVCDALGKVMFFEYDGSFRVESPPDPTVPVWTVNHGRNGVLVKASRTKTREGVYNAWVVSGDRAGEGEAAPVSEYVLDDDPLSPTYWFGPFGKVPKFFNSSFVKTSAQAVEAAQAMKTRAKGLPYNINLGFIPNPGIEVNDPITVTYQDSMHPEVHILDQVVVPLTPDVAMTSTSRRVRESE